MFVTALAAGLLMFADTTPAAAPQAPAQTAEAKPAMKKVCVRDKTGDTMVPRTTCRMVPVKSEEEAAKAPEGAPKSATE